MRLWGEEAGGEKGTDFELLYRGFEAVVKF
jgi:hypothetical protein